MCLMDWIFIGTIYVLIGTLVSSCVLFSSKVNPLWKLPICLLWPLWLLLLAIYGIATELFIPWVRSVVDFYKEKG